ncbi:hypothetical protein J4E89_009943 [Alternaria sp. Ai002NY15]|nr:hypothetical protein J4E89_009943 [Alternaria sp. Ai002NY15]
MRLIDTTTLELRSFMDEYLIPPYAILSHRWGEDEVTLQQFTDQSLRNDATLKSSRGYWKILKTCQQALSSGLSLVWVDTCCIDKTSSAELSEAINSMFRWYQQAAGCYAYLEDINVDSEIWADGPISDEVEQQLVRSRWFTRGWTLQELLAPKNVWFYGNEWRYIGKKSSLCVELERITGIDVNVLSGESDLSDESVAKRMSWMAGRTTTRIEDMAYSLLGIFDVNMPLLYGEGKKAFVRLQEEIMRFSADQSLFAWEEPHPLFHAPTSVFSNHPIQFRASRGILNRRFDDELRLPDDYLCTNRGVKIKLRIRKTTDEWGGEAPIEDVFLAVLDCRYEDPKFENCWPAITIRSLKGPKGQYTRVEGPKILPVVFGDVSDAQKQMGVISVGDIDDGEWVYLRAKVPGWAAR